MRTIERGFVKVALCCIFAYRICISPFLPRACRFEPTCSEYAAQALAKHGLIRGIGLALHRLLRCNPSGRL
jgi:putative membrane protein insertion efficiency factor